MSVRVSRLGTGLKALSRGMARPAGPFGLVLWLLLGPMLGGFGQIDRRVDQSKVSEPLRKIPE